jgi:hypothetical protein
MKSLLLTDFEAFSFLLKIDHIKHDIAICNCSFLKQLESMVMFWGKSSVITSMISQLTDSNDCRLQHGRAKENSIAGTVLVAFVSYITEIIAGRVIFLFDQQTAPGQWNQIPFPWININEMQDQITMLFLRNY